MIIELSIKIKERMAVYNFLVVVLLATLSNALHDEVYKDNSDSLKKDGINVCSYTEQLSRREKISFRQEKVVTVWQKTCCAKVIFCWKYCNESRLAKKSYLEYQTVTKYFTREHYHCCSGYDQVNKDAEGCEKPVCNIKCRNGGECVAPDTCKCKEGFEGKFCQLDVDECASKKTNNCQQTCLNTNGGHECACQRGFVLNDDKTTCSDINECNANSSSLYVSPPCQCKDKSQKCGAKCVNLPGSHKCECGEGYRLNGAEECEDINECAETTGLCDQGCVNTPGSYYCKCDKGFRHDGVSCKDIDECKIDNGGCSDNCHNLNGTHLCSCPDRFYLGNDTKTCKPINGSTFKKQITCESDVVGYLECDKYDEKLAILDVMYGRLSENVCQYGDYKSNLRCISPNGMKHLQECNFKNTCVFYFDQDDLGDPCPGVEKYMEITYDCLK